MERSGNPTDITVYVRGVRDVPAAVDTHTAWGQGPGPHQPQMSLVIIGECSSFNDNSQVIPAFASLLTNLF
jgi:hypothetical protein